MTDTISINAAPVILVPWDPDSPDHVERMRLQRIACGWDVEQVDHWREAQSAGEMGLHWVVLHPDHPKTTLRLDAHLAAFPNEVEALQDSSKMILGHPHKSESLMRSFHPVGHVAITTVAPKPELETSLANGILSLMTFYISTVLQNNGLGGAALRLCEKMAKEELGAKTLTLETIASDFNSNDNPLLMMLGLKPTVLSNQDWYSHYGYKVYRDNVTSVYFEKIDKEWPVRFVDLRKDLA
ncbi:hypothetical protein GGS21DRAFT_502376 [Xylaria nigripes]|nr:hypothetical protein GGS21DRAFT_502376 [Xylaria nigripes]